jgi:hypothetical protein
LDFAQAEAFAKLVSAFGLPFWAGMVLWGFYQIRRLLSGAIEALRARDDRIETMLDHHIASTDKRIALLEQLLSRHDRNIEDIWERLSNSGQFKSNGK